MREPAANTRKASESVTFRSVFPLGPPPSLACVLAKMRPDSRAAFAAVPAAPGMVPDASRWETTSSLAFRHANPVTSPVTSRPIGTDIGTSRPWPAQNAFLLSQRVPASWVLDAGQPPPSREQLVNHVHSLHYARQLLPSSQRDAARGYSHLLARSYQQEAPLPTRPSTSAVGLERTWVTLSCVADLGPRKNGA